MSVVAGVDDRGIELELGVKQAVEDPDLIIVFHAMPTEFRKGGKKW